jgi:hypothetical protein
MEDMVLQDTLKTTIVYLVNNISNKTIGKIEVKATVRKNKFIKAYAKVSANNLDKINRIGKIELKIENDMLILSVFANAEDEPTPKFNKDTWVRSSGLTIFLCLTKEGNLRSLTANSSPEDADLRCGGDFLDQANGIFKTYNTPIHF